MIVGGPPHLTWTLRTLIPLYGSAGYYVSTRME